MKFKIKKSYNVLGRKTKIKLMNTHDFAGMYDPDKDTIYISTNQSEEQIIETFWHELIHNIQYQTGINQAVSRELLEVMAETGSRVIAEILKKI
jgi:Zn-dependent peptidase ImmA (M78 family)